MNTKENWICPIHATLLDKEGMCAKCMEGNNK